MLLTGGIFKGPSHVDIYYIMPLPAHAKKEKITSRRVIKMSKTDLKSLDSSN